VLYDRFTITESSVVPLHISEAVCEVKSSWVGNTNSLESAAKEASMACTSAVKEATSYTGAGADPLPLLSLVVSEDWG
jgi:hypothetical protein